MTAGNRSRIATARLAAALLGAAAALAMLAGPGSGRAAAEPVEFAPGEVLVQYEPGVDADRRRALRAQTNATLEGDLPLPRLELVAFPPGEHAPEAARALERLPGVAYAEPNYYRTLDRAPDDPFFDRLWGLENGGQSILGFAGTAGADIDALRAWETTTGSADVTVAVVDDGVDYTHPDLEANIWLNPGESGEGRETNGVDDDGNGRVDDWRGWDFVGNDNNPWPWGPDSDHGTHVAGTIGAVGDNEVGIAGVNWSVGLMPARVFDADGYTTISRLVNAYAYAAANGAAVLNGSFGGGGFSRTERNAIAAAPETLFVVAAGNSGDDNDVESSYPCTYALDNIVCVAATDNRDRLAWFSNYGEETVDLGAPGRNVYSTVRGEGYEYFSGTSMATPHVAGVAALLRAADPDASVAQLRDRLFAGVDPLPSLAGRVATGGRLNAFWSLAFGDSGTADRPAVTAPDTTAPTTVLKRKPARWTKRRRAVLRFRADEPVRGFRCKLDRRQWRACGSPKRYRKLNRGRHVFRVRAIDTAGNIQRTPTKWAWRIRPR